MSTFIPYFYYPNRTSDTLIFVSPLGIVRLTTTIAIQIVASIVLVIASTFIFFCLKRRQREEEQENEEIDKNISALQASIKKKGENSYYYAHQKKDEESGSQEKILKKTITKYSWTDQTKNVKIYIRVDDLPDIDDDDINLSWSSTSVDLTIKSSSGDSMCFAVKHLHSKINKAVYKRKESMITLSLEKSKKDDAWSTLHALKKHDEDNIEYDQSLYD